MTFTYDPSTVQEKDFAVIPEGYYPFETVSAEETVSRSSQKDMIVITINVFDKNGSIHPHKSYVTENSLYHLKNFWDSVGSPEIFDAMKDKFDPLPFKGKCGIVKTCNQESEYKGFKYTNSRIQYFVKKKDQNKEIGPAESQAFNMSETFHDDEIPF